MARDRFEEAIRLYVETSGDAELKQLADQLARMGDVSDASAQKANELLSEFEKLATVGNNIQSFVRLKAELSETGEKLEEAKANLAKLGAEFDRAEQPSERLQRSLAKAAREVQELTKQQNRQQAELTRSTNALRAADVDTTNLGKAYADLQDKMGGFAARAGGAADALERAGRDGKKAASGLDSIEKAARASAKSLGTVATRLTGVAGAATAALGALASLTGAKLFSGAIQSATTLEEALSQVRAVSGATAQEMEALKVAAEAGGAATRFSTLEAARGLGELARATGSATTAIAALPATLSLAQAAGIGVADAAQLMTTTLTQFGLGADQAVRVADTMAKEVNSTTDSMAELGNALSYSAPLAKQLGLDLEDTTAIIGALADEGFRGERAGTALRNVFSEMLDPASSFAQALRDMGIESTDFATVIEQLAQQGDKGRVALLELDAAARPAISALVDKGGAGLATLEAALRGATGEAERTAKVMGDNLSGAVEGIQDSFDRTRRALIEPLLEPLQKELVALSTEMEAFAKSPEFEEIKTALLELFGEGAKAARELVNEVDFAELARNLKESLGDAGKTLTEFRENISLIVDAATITADSVSVVFNAVQTAVLATAGTISAGISVIAGAIDQVSMPVRKILELVGLIEKGQFSLAEFSGGMNAVADEFFQRTGTNFDETLGAAQRWGDGIGEAGSTAASGLKDVAEASGNAASASDAVAAGADEATRALAEQAKAAEAAAGQTDQAAAKMDASAERLKKAFADLGIQSQESLERSAEAARRNFDLIREAASKGAASAEDARRAFAAYATAARAAVTDSGESARVRLEGELRVHEAVLGVTDSLSEMGTVGQAAGAAIAAGAQQASAALIGAGQAGRSAAAGTDAAGSAADAVSKHMKEGSKAGQQFALSMYEVSEQAMRAYMATNRLAGSRLWAGAVNRVTDQVNDQGKALQEQVRQLEEANAQFDELAGRRRQLAQKFDMLGAGEVERLLQAEQRLEANRKRRAEEEARVRTAALEDTERAAKAVQAATPAAPTIVGRGAQLDALTVKLETTGGRDGSPYLTKRDLELLSREITAMVIRELRRSQATST